MSKMYRELIICAFFITSWCSLTLADPSANNNKSCGDIGDCPTSDTDCKDICGCDKTIPTTFDNKTQQCIINIKLLVLSLKEKYNTEDDNDFSSEDNGMATKIRAEADKIFKGVIVAAFLFIACAATCTLTACIYCCRMNYTDYQLKKSIKVLAKKMGTKSQLRTPAPKATKTTEPIAESCNVVVEDAGLGVFERTVNMIEVSLLDTVVMTLTVIITMTLLSCLCCVCMKISDLRMKSHILEMANRKGIELDLDKINPKHSCQSPHSNENCTILIPEVALIL